MSDGHDYVLGVNIGFHDSSAALLRDGELRWLIEQERVSRRKHAFAQPPADAVAECLRAEGITPDDVTAVAIGWDFSGTPLEKNRRFRDEGLTRLVFGDDPPEQMPAVRWVPHHLAHAASTYHVSGHDEAAVLVMDGSGERDATSIGVARGGEIDFTRTWPASQSLGFFYTAASKWAGFGDWGTGKLMGLAAYGRPRGTMPLRRTSDGYEISTNGAPVAVATGRRAAMGPMMAYFPGFDEAVTPSFCTHFPYAARSGEEAIAYADFAASVQDALESAVLGLAEDLRRTTGLDAIVLAGGVAMNCTLVGRLVRSGLFSSVYLPPVPTDAGVSLGAAIVAARELGHRRHGILDHAYWGRPIGDDDAVRAAISGAGLVVEALPGPALHARTAEIIADGGVVGWARGRSEIGQRALGSRSLLADPRNRRTLERLNNVKGREMWRPVAPSILAEHLHEVMATPVGHPANFMLAAGQVRGDMRTALPAVTHVDGSARPQRVNRGTNPDYWALIEQFRARSGVAVVVNTSLNLAGEPIVDSAADAVSTFCRAPGMDALVVGDLLVLRNAAPGPD